jgi:beta-lactamase superfamily II metal-dependent hydrolase
MVTHPEKDHYEGLIDVLDRYTVRAVLYNGRVSENDSWVSFVEKIHEKEIPFLAMRAGDSITYKDAHVRFLWPDDTYGGEGNDASLVCMFYDEERRVLFSGDIGFSIEEKLVENYDIDADVLKAPHHGSKFSSGASFMSGTTPLFTVFSAGRDNSYGHPSEKAMDRVARIGSEIYRTDTDGGVHVYLQDGMMSVFTREGQ